MASLVVTWWIAAFLHNAPLRFLGKLSHPKFLQHDLLTSLYPVLSVGPVELTHFLKETSFELKN